LVAPSLNGESLVQHPEKKCDKLPKQILEFSRRVISPGQIKAACIYGESDLGVAAAKTVVQALVIVRDFQPKLMNYVKVIDDRNVAVLAADEWVFERDVDRGFLGEALAWGLILPYYSLTNRVYLHDQEVKLKKRLILELLENLVLDFPELSHTLCIKPEYFMYQAALSRAKLFPPITHNMLGFLRKGTDRGGIRETLVGYLEALKHLEKEHAISFSDGYAIISEDFISNARSAKTRLTNLSRTLPRTLFTSALGIFPKILNILSQNRETLFKLQKTEKDAVMINQVEAPEEYVLVPTASGLVPLSSRLGIEATARKILSMSKDEKIEIKAIGGVLNDVFLIKAPTKYGERKLVVKRFKDWSSFKWFPLALWSIGTRTFAILGRSRLEKECAINRLLHSKGIKVPKLLYVNSDERLVFMDYIEGETVNNVIRRLAGPNRGKKAKKDLKIIERVGKRLAKVHAIGVSLGDTKPENMIIGKNGEIYLMDFEQASRGGDQVWDVAEFLYYAGHDIPPVAQKRIAETIAETFIVGYLKAGGKGETIRKAANPKYTKVFSIFTLPHIILSISNTCRKALTFEA
jgi:tRNA A-37 threonylcarbamoyl transferase component Bud32